MPNPYADLEDSSGDDPIPVAQQDPLLSKRRLALLLDVKNEDEDQDQMMQDVPADGSPEHPPEGGVADYAASHRVFGRLEEQLKGIRNTCKRAS